MANQQARKKIRVAPGGGGGMKESLINQVLKKTGVAKPLKTSTPKRLESGSESKELSKELSSIHDSSDLPAKVKSENIPLNNHKNSNNKNSCNGSSGSPLAPTGA